MLLFFQAFPEIVKMPLIDAEEEEDRRSRGGGQEEPGRNSLLLPAREARRSALTRGNCLRFQVKLLLCSSFCGVCEPEAAAAPAPPGVVIPPARRLGRSAIILPATLIHCLRRGDWRYFSVFIKLFLE